MKKSHTGPKKKINKIHANYVSVHSVAKMLLQLSNQTRTKEQEPSRYTTDDLLSQTEVDQVIKKNTPKLPAILAPKSHNSIEPNPSIQIKKKPGWPKGRPRGKKSIVTQKIDTVDDLLVTSEQAQISPKNNYCWCSEYQSIRSPMGTNGNSRK